MRAGWRWTRQRRRGRRDDRAGNRESSRDAVRHGAGERACRLSGVSTRKPLTIRRDRPRTEKSCGPDARGLCVKSSGDVAARPGVRISHPQGDGGNSASLPGESTKDTVKTIRAGKAGRSATPSVHPVCTLVAHGPTGAAGARPSLRPLASERANETLKLGRNAPREREGVSAIWKAH
jgi:hypothetical protein